MEKFKKIDKKFLLSDETVNAYGFRLLTSGYQIEEYKKNPIGYLMHERDKGVLLKWEDLTIEGDKVYGKPVINMSHPRAQQTVDEIENGFLNAASLGHFVVLETSEDPALMKEGQTGPTVTKWFNRECSLVDIPGNYNSLSVTLVDKDNNPINLSDFTKQKISNMDKIVWTAEQLAAMNLMANASQEAANKAFNDLVAKAKKSDDLEKQLNDLKAETTEKEVKGLLKTALDSKKITKELSDSLADDYKENPTGLKNLLDKLPEYVGVKDQLKDDKQDEGLKAKSWDELHQTGQLENLKANDPETFKAKYKEKYGVEPKI